MDKAAHLKKLRETFDEFFQAIDELPGDEWLRTDDPRIDRLVETMEKATRELMAWAMSINGWLNQAGPKSEEGTSGHE